MKKFATILVLMSFHGLSIAQWDNFHYLNQSTGLPSSNVKKIVQDSYGFIWMATQDGVSRFDGSECVQIKRPVLNGNDVSDMYFDSSTRWLWISFSLGGINAIDTRTLSVEYTTSKEPSFKILKGKSIRKILLDSKKRVWIGTDQGLFILEIKNKVEKINSQDFIDASIVGLAEDINHNILVSLSNSSLIIFVKGSIKKRQSYQFNYSNFFYSSTYNNVTDRLVFGGKRNVVLFDLSTRIFKSVDNSTIHAGDNYFALERDKNNIWISTQKGLFVLNLATTKFSSVEFNQNKNSDLRNIALNIFFDNRKNVWISTMGGCYYSTEEFSPFKKYSHSITGNLLNHLYDLYINQNHIFICDEAGLYKMKLSSDKPVMADSSKSYYLFFKDFNNQLIASTSDGLYFWDILRDCLGIPVTNVYPELKSIMPNVFSSVAYFGDSLIILGSDDNTGIYLWKVKNHSLEHISEKSSGIRLKDASVIKVCKKDKHSIFILSNTSIQLFNILNYEVKDVSMHFPGINYFYDVCILNGKYFFATYGSGIIETDTLFNVKKIFDVQSGLSNNCVYRVVDENDSTLWATTNFGLNRINVNNRNVKAYYKEDGLNTNEFEEYSATKYLDQIYAGGINGFTKINPPLIKKNTQPPIFYFTKAKIATNKREIIIDDVQLEKIVVPNNWLQMSVYFTGLNYSNPTRVSYAYRVTENGNEWIMNSRRSFIDMIGLSPGKYHLEVKSSNEDGYWSESKTLLLIIEPKWFQTWWFYGLISLCIFIICFLFYKYRINQIKSEQDRIRSIREEIASDLHDDIGSTLNSVKIFTHLAETENDKQIYFKQIQVSLKQMSEGLRDMIWVLDDKNDSVENLIDRLKLFAIPAASGSGMNIIFNYEELQRAILKKKEKRNLLMITKEAINNSIKYSGCKNIAVSFSIVGHKKKLTIYDDGKGFNEDEIKLGNGLKNMRNRARQINYTIQITSTSSKGTTIQINNE